MGAWIEILYICFCFGVISVAPLVGAWIEISMLILPRPAYLVAPLVGAWIEIISVYHISRCMQSLPLWERGLKLISALYYIVFLKVAPLVGAWIEIFAYMCA